jgi:hypothetical protein
MAKSFLNNQQPTTNIEHPKLSSGQFSAVGCWMFDVGCSMFSN